LLTCIKHNAGGKEEEGEVGWYKMRNKIIRKTHEEDSI
jgi:hypothetical protein